MSTVSPLAALFLLLSPLASVGFAQFITSSMSGAVQDASGAAIPEAAVTLTQVATGRQRTTVTGSDGTFVYTALEAGEYFLTVAKDGFATAERKSVVVETGQRYPVGLIVLQVGALSEVASVSAKSAVVETQSGERSLSISTSQIAHLSNMGRDFKTLVQLVPGIVNFSNPAQPGARVSFNALGMRNTTNNITIDGTPITSTDYPAEHFANVSVDSIEEVKILTSNYQAEYGRLSGANVEVVTKSGTRDFHGLGSYFTRHEQFNATNFFDNREGRDKPRYRYNTWTYNLGGPIYIPGKFNTDKSKLFFFFSQEHWPREGVDIDQVKVPTVLERQGDFSQSFDLDGNLITVTDPVTQEPYAGNRIPRSQLDSSGLALLNAFPEPNFFDDNISGGNYHFVSEFPTSNKSRYDALKIDYNFNSNNFLTVSYTGATGSSTGPGRANWPQLPTNGDSLDQTSSVRYTRVLSPTVLNEFHVGWTRSNFDTTSPADALARNQRDSAGFTAGSLFPEGKPLDLLPWAEFGGVPGTPATLEYLDRYPFESSFQTILISDRFSIVRGSHNLKFGVSFERNSREMGTQGGSPFGAFNFGTNANNPLDTGYAYANAAAGGCAADSGASGGRHDPRRVAHAGKSKRESGDGRLHSDARARDESPGSVGSAGAGLRRHDADRPR
ncbi:MAG: TonB-dependent receptor plug domain-containing protein [Luteitalea sp.]|nr:TonB-dependent receptor plug domain-containing protein [Luteitalea sp.]